MSRKRVRPEQVLVPARPSEPEAPKEEPESLESIPEGEVQAPVPDETPEPEQPTPDQPSQPTLADVFAILTDLKQMLSDEHEMLQSAPRASRKRQQPGCVPSSRNWPTWSCARCS